MDHPRCHRQRTPCGSQYPSSHYRRGHLDLDELLGVIPSATGVGHHDGKHGTRGDRTSNHTGKSAGTKENQ